MMFTMTGEISMQDDPIIAQRALDFVNSLVPGSFESAKKFLDESCKYHFGEKTLTGDGIIQAFEESHLKAKATLDSIEYLPGIVDSFDGNRVTIRVFDRITLRGKFHLYSDRLAITLKPENDEWWITRIEHLPFPEERLKLSNFLQASCPHSP